VRCSVQHKAVPDSCCRNMSTEFDFFKTVMETQVTIMKSQFLALSIAATLFLATEPALARGGGGGGGGGGGHGGGFAGGHAGGSLGHTGVSHIAGHGRDFGFRRGFLGGGLWGYPGYYDDGSVVDENLPPPGQDLDNFNRQQDERRAGLGAGTVKYYGPQ
jgi:hypothetical protein